MENGKVTLQDGDSDANHKKHFCSIRIVTAVWILLIALASFLAPNIFNFDMYEKQIIHPKYRVECDAEKYRQNFYIQSENTSPSPFENIYLPIYSSHNIFEYDDTLTTAIVSIHGYSRSAGDHCMDHISNFHMIYIFRALFLRDKECRGRTS
jgi:hypothetical protein